MRSVPTDVSAPIKNLQSKYLNDEDDRLQLIKLDTTDDASVQAAAAEVAKLKPDGLDYLINNAGEVHAAVCVVYLMSMSFIIDVKLYERRGQSSSNKKHMPQLNSFTADYYKLLPCTLCLIIRT